MILYIIELTDIHLETFNTTLPVGFTILYKGLPKMNNTKEKKSR